MLTLDRRADRTYGHIDVSTGDDAQHVTRTFTLFTDAFERLHQEWTFPIRLPVTIWEAMRSDWSTIERKLDTRQGSDYSVCEFVIASAYIMGGSPAAIQRQLQKMFADTLYRVFCEKQIAAGNKAWLAPGALQETRNPDGL